MSELNRAIGAWRGTGMMLNIVLGAGLLTLPGLAYEAVGGAALLVWLACAVAAVPLLLVFGLLGRKFPDAGGIAAVMKRAFGAFGYIPATFLFLGAVAVGLPGIAITGGYYASAAIGGPAYLYAALLLVAALLANLLSAEIASRVNAAIASVVVVTLIIIAIVGWMAVRPEWSDLATATDQMPTLGAFGLAFMMVFFAFTGWEVSANLGGEFRNPDRDFPLAMGLSFVIAVGLYLTLAIVVVASGPIGADEAPFAQIFRQEFGEPGARIVAFVSVALIYANLSAAIWAVSRMVYSASREGLLFGSVSTLYNGVPMNAVLLTVTVLVGVVLLAWQGVLDLGKLLAIAGQNFLLLYAGAAAALVSLGTRPWHRALGWASLGLVAVLMIGRGANGLYYPGALIAAGCLVAAFRLRSASHVLDAEQESS